MRKITLSPERPSGRFFTNSEIADMYREGMAIMKIKKKVGKSDGQLYTIFAKEGVEINRKKFARLRQVAMQRVMLKDQKDGMTVRAIAKKYKMTHGNACNLIYNI